LHRLANLQALRFFAASAVMLYHAPHLYERAGGAIDLKPFVSAGFFGVDVFFVLSGFVMWLSAAGKSGGVDALIFAFRRAMRVYLTFWIVFAAIFFYMQTWAPSRLANVDLARSFFLVPQSVRTNIHGISWSLSYELYFYLLVSLAIMLGGRRMLVITGATAIAVMIAGRLGWSIPFRSMLTGSHLFEFLAGCLVAVAYERGLIGRPIVLLAIGLGILAAAMAFAAFWLPHPLEYGTQRDVRVAWLLPSAVCIVAGFVGLERKFRLPQWTVTLGDASYGIYLWHPFVFIIWFDLVKPRDLSQTSLPLTLLAAIAAVLCLSLATTIWIERPALRRLKRRTISPTVGTPTRAAVK